MKRPKTWRLRAASALLVVACAAAVVLFLPANLGGSATYLTTHGTSMEPNFHTGDLAIIKPVNDYNVGDVVAYRSHQLNTVVMHRIVKIDGLHYVFKGDHNSWKDPEHPTRADLVGKLWLHVPHGGSALDVIHRARLFILGGAVLLFTGTTGLVVGRRRRRKRRAAAAAQPVRSRTRTAARRPRQRGARSPAHQPNTMSRAARRGSKRLRFLGALEYGAGVALVVCLVAGTLAWAHVPTKYVSDPIPFTNRGTFAYSAPVNAGPVYGEGGLKTGDPVYLRIVNQISVHFGYRFVAADRHDVSGTIALSANVQDVSGWHQTVPLVAPTGFSGSKGQLDTTLDIAQLQSLIAAAAGATGVRPSTQTVTLVADVKAKGALAGQPVDSDFTPTYPFDLDSLVLKPSSAGTGAKAIGTTPTTRDSIPNSVKRAATIGAFGLAVDVSIVRWVTLGAGVLALLVLLVVFTKRRPLHRNEVASIDARDGRIIVPVASSSPGTQRVATVDVTTMPDLVRLAERYDRLILHQARDGTHVYLFEAEGIVYRYSTHDLHHRPGAPVELSPVDVAVDGPVDGQADGQVDESAVSVPG
jgi:signal peptidase I